MVCLFVGWTKPLSPTMHTQLGLPHCCKEVLGDIYYPLSIIRTTGSNEYNCTQFTLTESEKVLNSEWGARGNFGTGV